MDAKFHVLTSVNGRVLRAREHRKRRQHTKDRHGCAACKQKRVKCDQRQPTCLRCIRNSRECIYEDSPSSSSSSPKSAGKAAEGDRSALSPCPLSAVTLAASSLSSVVASIVPSNPWIKKHGTSVDHLLHHFSNNSTVIMGPKLDAQFWELACRNKYVVSSMLAVSACHLRHYTPNPAPHRIAELGQESVAISALQSAIIQPLHKDRADAMLCAAVMLNAVSFAFLDGDSLSSSWVFSDSPDRLDWLDMQMRFKKLEQATMQFRKSSFMEPILDAADGPPLSPGGSEDADLEKVPAAWRRLIGTKDSPSHRIYREPVRDLAELKVLQPDCPGALAHIGFVAKLDERFRDLLFDRDPRAVWIFGYWLALVGRLSLWWCSRRVKRDWAAALSFLEEKGLGKEPGEDGQMWRTLIADLKTAAEWSLPPIASSP